MTARETSQKRRFAADGGVPEDAGRERPHGKALWLDEDDWCDRGSHLIRGNFIIGAPRCPECGLPVEDNFCRNCDMVLFDRDLVRFIYD